MKTLYYLLILLLLSYSYAFADGKDSLSDSLHYFTPNQINYDKVIIGSKVIDTLIKIYNKDSKVMNLKSAKFVNDTDTLFSSNLKFNIITAKNGYAYFQLSLKPISKTIGYDTIYYRLFFTIENVSDSITLPLYLFFDDITKGTSEIDIPDLNAKVGDKFEMPIILNKFDETLNINKFTISISFDASIMCLDTQITTSRINYGNNIISLTKEFKKNPKAGDVLFSIPMIAALGDVVKSDIVIGEANWYSNNLPIENIITFKNGSLAISDIFYYGTTPRLITKIIDTLEIELPENIITSDFQTEIKYNGIAKFQIYSYFGNLIYEYSNLTVHKDYIDELVTINRSIFSAKGVYILKLSNELDFVSKMIVVE